MEMSRIKTGDPIAFEGFDTIVKLWADRCAKYGDRTCHREKELGIWKSYSWRDYYETTKKIGLALMDLGVQKGEPVLILAFVVIVIGGIGSIKGAFIGALLVGLTETLGRFLLPEAFALVFDPATARSVGASLASMSIYILMAGVLIFRPKGLFGSA